MYLNKVIALATSAVFLNFANNAQADDVTLSPVSCPPAEKQSHGSNCDGLVVYMSNLTDSPYVASLLCSRGNAGAWRDGNTGVSLVGEQINAGEWAYRILDYYTAKKGVGMTCRINLMYGTVNEPRDNNFLISNLGYENACQAAGVSKGQWPTGNISTILQPTEDPNAILSQINVEPGDYSSGKAGCIAFQITD